MIKEEAGVISLIARALTRGLAAADGPSTASLVGRRALGVARRSLLLAVDPTVRYRIGGVDLALPLSHELPAIRAQHPGYSENLVRLVAALAASNASGSIIDIGANVGDTVALMRQAVPWPILGIEPDPVFFEYLRRNTEALPDVELESALVGTGETTQHVLARANGTAGLVSGGGREAATQSLRDIVARHPRVARPTLLKIDTDGFDCLILLSNLDWLAEIRPVVFWEYAPAFWPQGHQGQDVFAELRKCGYGSLLVYESTGEFRQRLTLDDTVALEEVHATALGWGRRRYLDFAAFPAELEGAVRRVRAEETRRLREGS